MPWVLQPICSFGVFTHVFWDAASPWPGVPRCTHTDGLFPGQESSTGAEMHLATLLARGPVSLDILLQK